MRLYCAPRFAPLALAATLLASLTAQAESCYVVELRSLQIETEQPEALQSALERTVRRQTWLVQDATHFPTAQLTEPTSTAYIAFPAIDEDQERNSNRWSVPQGGLLIAFQLDDATEQHGKLSLNYAHNAKIQRLKFTFDPSTVAPTTSEAFDAVRKAHYDYLAQSPIPGGAWFRHLAEKPTTDDIPALNSDPFAGPRSNNELNDTFNLFSGNRALSENLALDRALILAESENATPVAIDSIQGISVQAIDWSNRLNAKETAIDPLAAHIPEDQHAAFFPSIKALNTALHTWEDETSPALQSFQTINPYSALALRYQTQMGLLLPDLIAEQLPIRSVAITGGDPFFPSGTDVALLFETADPEALFTTMTAFIRAQATLAGAAPQDDRPAQQHAFTSSDRSFASYILKGANYVAVANSPAQIARLTAASAGTTAALGTTDEFKYFRQRYPLNSEATGFIFLSDATIRRWAGPEIRIGASRRTRAAAVLNELTAQHIDQVELSNEYAPLIGTHQIHGTTLQSEHYNTLAFMTPIADLEINTVTPAEAEAYNTWRRGYENGWSQVFDPIALSLQLDDTRHAIDLSVIPLTIGSDYDEWIEIVGNARLDAPARSAHPEALFFAAVAIDNESAPFMQASNISQSMVPGFKTSPLAWIGDSISIFIDDSPYWQAAKDSESPERYIEDHIGQFPLGIRIDSQSTVRLALFLTGIRSFAEQAAPGLLQWQTHHHNEQPYVSISADSAQTGGFDITLYYAAQPEALLLSLDENVLQRAMARAEAAKAAPDSEPKELAPQQMFASVQLEAWQNIPELDNQHQLQAQQNISWSALPILNEWHKRFQEIAPVQTHLTYFKEHIRCPSGQGYQWNPEQQSMESITYGTPVNPRGTTITPLFNEKWKRAEASLNFEDDGLRIRAQIETP